MTKRKQDPFAKRSGFARQLLAYFADNEAALKLTGSTPGPANAAALARHLTSRGRPASQRAVAYWERALNLPAPRYIPLLEELLGAPWLYIDEAKNPKISDEQRAFFLANYAADPKTRERAALALKHLAARGRA